MGQIVSVISLASNSLLFLQTLTYDSAGNRVGSQLNNGSISVYSYDGKNRLVADTTTGTNAHTYNYSYDPNGDLLATRELLKIRLCD